MLVQLCVKTRTNSGGRESSLVMTLTSNTSVEQIHYDNGRGHCRFLIFQPAILLCGENCTMMLLSDFQNMVNG